jgi:hypothetical protein
VAEDILKHIAVHEAGHAVIGRILGLLCGHVSIRPNDRSAGRAITNGPLEILDAWEKAGRFRKSDSVYSGWIMTSQAAAEAEAEILGTCSGGDGNDRCKVRLMAEQMDVPCDGEALRPYARRLVKHHRNTIERMAAILLGKKWLTRAQADEVVWPKAAMAGFITFEELRRRFNIVSTLNDIEMNMRVGFFPRAYMFNRRIAWRVRDIEAFMASRR